MLPSFIGIGATKAGSTWLHVNLEKHPRLWLPPIKELHYFNRILRPGNALKTRLLGRGMQHRLWRDILRAEIKLAIRNVGIRHARWKWRFFFREMGAAWYAGLFPGGNGLVAGEISPGYADLEPEEMRHLHALLPHAKVIYLLREPLQRAW